MSRLALAGTAAAIIVAGCGGAVGKPKMATVGGDRVTVASLVDAEAGLCTARLSAATEPAAARAAFFDRAHDAIHSVARGLQDVDRSQAAGLLEAKERVEAGLDSRPPTLAADIAHLAEAYRAGLRRLAIAAPPCEK